MFYRSYEEINFEELKLMRKTEHILDLIGLVVDKDFFYIGNEYYIPKTNITIPLVDCKLETIEDYDYFSSLLKKKLKL